MQLFAVPSNFQTHLLTSVAYLYGIHAKVEKIGKWKSGLNDEALTEK